MTIAGLPGIPGGSALVPALDMFIADAMLDHKQARVLGETPKEICGALLYRHIEPHFNDEYPSNIDWTGEIDFVRLANTHLDPTAAFAVNTSELLEHVQIELKTLEQLCILRQTPAVNVQTLFASGFSPLVGIVHSHPSGTIAVSAADHALSDGAATWRRATAPGALVLGPEEAKFFEADFLFAHDQEVDGKGTLVHFKRGSVRGTWEGNFLPKD